jgi:hypothetical protein
MVLKNYLTGKGRREEYIDGVLDERAPTPSSRDEADRAYELLRRVGGHTKRTEEWEELKNLLPSALDLEKEFKERGRLFASISKQEKKDYKRRLRLDKQTRRRARIRGFLENMSFVVGYGSTSA